MECSVPKPLESVYHYHHAHYLQAKKQFEIMSVSADRDASSFITYFQHHTWLALPYEAPSRTQVSGYFQVSGIPRSIVFGPTGAVINYNNNNIIKFIL
jgi:hypothetical protein